MSRSMSANARAIDYVLRVAVLNSTARPARTLTMSLSDAGLRYRPTKLIYTHHRLPPKTTEDVTRDRSNRLLALCAAAVSRTFQ
jgi:hypothetical protein